MVFTHGSFPSFLLLLVLLISYFLLVASSIKGSLCALIAFRASTFKQCVSTVIILFINRFPIQHVSSLVLLLMCIDLNLTYLLGRDVTFCHTIDALFFSSSLTRRL